MLSYARATRGLRRPSLDTRSGRPSSPPSREKVEYRCSFDARIRGSTTLPAEERAAGLEGTVVARCAQSRMVYLVSLERLKN